MVICSVRTLPHVEHFEPSVRPVFMQAAFSAAMTCGVWTCLVVACAVCVSLSGLSAAGTVAVKMFASSDTVWVIVACTSIVWDLSLAQVKFAVADL